MQSKLTIFSKNSLENIVAVIGYIALSQISQIWSNAEISTSTLWPPAGFALAMMLLTENRVFPGLLLGGLLTAFYNELPTLNWQSGLLALTIGFGVALQALIQSQLLQRFTYGKLFFYRVQDVVIFTFVVAYLASVISAGFAMLASWILGFLSAKDIIHTWFHWWLGDAVGVVAMTPFMMAFYKLKLQFDREKLAELIFLLMILTITIVIAYHAHSPLAYIFIPFCIWAAISFGPRLAIIVAFIISIFSLWLEIQGYQKFRVLSLSESVFLLQGFVAVVFFTTMTLAAVLTERKYAQNELKEINKDLEVRVEQRTHDLDEKNQELDKALTYLKHTQAQLVQAEKMSSLGLLTTDFAQKINDPINNLIQNIPALKTDTTILINILREYLALTSQTLDKISDIKDRVNNIDLSKMIEQIQKLIQAVEGNAQHTAAAVKEMRMVSRVEPKN